MNQLSYLLTTILTYYRISTLSDYQIGTLNTLWPEYDKGLLLLINKLGTSTWDPFWVFSTNIIAWFPLYLFFIYLVVKYFSRPKIIAVGITVLFTLAFTLLFTEVVKELVQRVRPVNDPGIIPNLRIVIQARGYSFFSGHASNAMAVTTIMVCFLRENRKWVNLFFLWPLVFGMSRLYFGVHYPLDVLAGWLAGFLIALAIYHYLGRTLLNYAAYREAVTDGK